jgi:hypothetical protein
MKGEAITDLTYKLNMHSVSILSLEYEKIDSKSGYFAIDLVAEKTGSITSLLKDMVKNYEIYSDTITMDSSTGLYHSHLRVLSVTP